MRQATECPLSGTLDDAGAEPALVIDPAAGTIVAANATARQALELGPARLPVALDCAMPAIQQLRELDGDGATVALTFWTQRGCLRCNSEVSRPDEGRPLLHVRLLDWPHGAQTARATAAGAAGEIGLRARLAHELRTPIGAIVAYAEILKDEHFGPLGSDRYAGYARNIHESARHATSVVDSMLESEAEAPGSPQLTFADVDPAGIVESCLVVAAPLAEQAGLVLSADVPARLPRIVADAVSVRQMLLNLLTNAIKFARRGDQVKVSVAYEGDGPLRISVVDTGPGMEDVRTRSRTAPKSGKAGLGLGLPLTRTLAEANGAALAIDSALGRGTCATISFGKDRLVPV